MKKIFILLAVLFVLFAVAAVAAVVFISKIDSFRPQLLREVEKATQKKVNADKISIRWESGLALEVLGLTIAEPSANATDKPLADIPSLRAVLNFQRLLHKKVEIGAVVIDKPFIFLSEETPEPQTKLPTSKIEDEPGINETSSQSVLPLISFLVERFEIRNGTFVFQPKPVSGAPAPEIKIEKINAAADHIALNQSVPIHFDAAIFSNERNLEGQGSFKVETKSETFYLEKLGAELDLNKIRPEKINALLAPGENAAQIGSLSGKIHADVQPLTFVLNQNAVNPLIDVQLIDGNVELLNPSFKIENIQSKLNASPTEIELKQLSAALAGGTLAASGGLKGLGAPAPSSNFSVLLTKLQLPELVKLAGSPHPMNITGDITFAFQGDSAGADANAFQRNLRGQGDLRLNDIVVHDFNIMDTIFSSIAMIPGLKSRLESNLGPEELEKIKQKDTHLAPAVIPIRIQSGTFYLNEYDLQSDTFAIQGAGQGFLTGAFDIAGMIRIDSGLSDAMVRSVNELSALQNRNAEIEIPYSVQSDGKTVSPSVNLSAIGAKIAIAKTQSVLQNALQKKGIFGSGTEASGASRTGDVSTQSPSSDLMQGKTSDLQPPQSLTDFILQFAEATGNKNSQSSQGGSGS